jgi:N,N-dimethylformamidase
MSLSGYSDLWSVEPGEEIKFMISAAGDKVETQLVRLLHGHEHADSPGFQEREVEAAVNGSVPAVRQSTAAGSYIALGLDGVTEAADAVRLSLFVWPTLRAAAPQTIASMQTQEGEGWLVQVLAGRLRLSCTRGGTTETLEGPALALRQWAAVDALVAVREGRLGLSVAAARGAGNQSIFAEERPIAPGGLGLGDLFLLGGRRGSDDSDRLTAVDCFNGKVDSPVLRLGPEAAGERPPAPWHSGLPAPSGAAFAWDLAQEQDGTRAVDVSGNRRHGRVINAPARLMTGPHWDRTTTTPDDAPEQWSAIHLHEDDLDDAGWTPTASWTVPDETPSAIYALRVRNGDEEDHLPFMVRPKPGAPRADVVLVMPTFTYMAYANERLINGTMVEEMAGGGSDQPHPDPSDELLRSFPEWGLSLYDLHRDGSGCCYSSRLRPTPNVRPRYRFWPTDAPERFSADLYLVHFLHQIGQEVDVLTDEDLHRDGLSCLDPYKVVLTGSHPEYYSLEMLEATESYLLGGGKMMYLGGNGFYWVTSVDRERPHLIEVRRGYQGSRAWTSEPGEVHHSTTGEQGSIWRFRGRDPNRLVGVAFSAQSGSNERAAGYRRLADSHDPRAAFVFEGIDDDELIGDFGLINDGAAGYEIDRTDAALGAPADLLRLATSEGMHGPTYLKVVEDIGFTQTEVTGPTSAEVRADMTLLPYPNGGAVFSVGSCNWCAALSHADYRNNVARITENVLAGFLAS